eukprot:TRINITY_DN907_c0_g1_i1.p2 TRINITY_DN907_c0_g1~~TRINITY_DN907_c0_g1_i1.p2  ORF type:complete len:244 (+),score=1.19 TRINITY_DN907_c0_g1_i1:79-732(+)
MELEGILFIFIGSIVLLMALLVACFLLRRKAVNTSTIPQNEMEANDMAVDKERMVVLNQNQPVAISGIELLSVLTIVIQVKMRGKEYSGTEQLSPTVNPSVLVVPQPVLLPAPPPPVVVVPMTEVVPMAVSAQNPSTMVPAQLPEQPVPPQSSAPVESDSNSSLSRQDSTKKTHKRRYYGPTYYHDPTVLYVGNPVLIVPCITFVRDLGMYQTRLQG